MICNDDSTPVILSKVNMQTITKEPGGIINDSEEFIFDATPYRRKNMIRDARISSKHSTSQ